ncbi:DUF5813 family protein [Haloarchaeobius sp. DFWS5]|uniref:DUF5813 family protein n=1 Tax=Haloarchaeobius sp. DFWS5 TaxID=3446114 RepID=UPI003EB81DD9
MTDTPDVVTRAFDRHDAFTPSTDGFELDTTVFDAVVTAGPADGERDGSFHVEVRLPTLDAAVAGETVHEAVEAGWFETLELRLEDTFDVATTSTHDEPTVARETENDVVIVELDFVSWTASDGVDDAKALVEFVEGTYAQGIVPGYEYHGPAAQLLENAVQNSENATERHGRGPAP